MKNTGKFKVGTKFIGNINKAKMEVVSIEKRVVGTESDNLRECSEMVTIKDLKTGHLFHYGLMALEHCNVTIFELDQQLLCAALAD